ncbi:hypothetical protein ACL02T_08495 [Pseudonocardia sp. RS010]|uniref:hypothetical protein n=1 Tax=Pseudonocardia sp. RS010 TaxID=3385979 RepID=UPI0039A1E42E
MTNQGLVKFVVETDGRDPQEVFSLCKITFDSLNVRKADFNGAPAMTQAASNPRPETVNLFLTMLADSDDEFVESVGAVLSALSNFGLRVVGSPEIRSVKPVEPVTVKTDGVAYDEEAQELVIDTWAPSWHDLEIEVWKDGDRVTAMITDRESGRPLQQVVKLKKLTIKRPAGMAD